MCANRQCVCECRSYATAICELLDPSGRLFGQRIISQGAAGDGVQQDLTKRLMQVCTVKPKPLHAFSWYGTVPHRTALKTVDCAYTYLDGT